MDKELVWGRSRELLYGITKLIAETDSIGEGYGYCDHYTEALFREDIVEIGDEEGKADNYLSLAVEIYDLIKEHFVGAV